MARVTVEDCLENVANRFELVLVSSKRARQIANGKPALVDEENDKPTVIALREIAAGLVTADILEDTEEEEVVEMATEDMDAAAAEMSASPVDEAVAEQTQAPVSTAPVSDDVAAAIQAALKAELSAAPKEGGSE